MIGGGGQRRALQGAAWEWQQLLRYRSAVAVPDADPRAGPAVSRQELPDSKQELGEWTDLAQGANGAL